MKNAYVAVDLFNMFCGEKLGAGLYRDVFACKINPKWVVKVEPGRKKWCNVLEWATWHEWEHCPEVRRWLAPVHYISPDGHILIMSRTKPLNKRKLPKTLPRFLTDTQTANYGVIDGKIVCHDYASIISGLKLTPRKVRWTDIDARGAPL